MPTVVTETAAQDAPAGKPGCWAHSIGGCGGKLSREHVLSAALWSGPSVQVVGFPWCKDEPKTIGVSSLTAKILCEDHNSALSNVDTAGAGAFHTLEAAARLNDKRIRRPRRKFRLSRYEVDGKRLERWFLKTLINVLVSKDTPGTWALDGSPITDPPATLVRLAFGQEQFAKPLGLYAAAAVGENVVTRSAVELHTLVLPGDAIAGAVFTFWGWRFLLYLLNVPIPDAPVLLPGGDSWIKSEAMYHIGRFNNRVNRRLSHYVHVMWNLD